jgi:anti-sigma B factor antagonist
VTAGGVQFRWMGEQAVVTMPAEIDAVNAGAVHQALLAEVGHDAPMLIIDMSRTTFCDSAGVQVIIDTYNRATAAGTRLRLVATAVVRILTLVGVDQLVPIYPTLEEALAGAPEC